MLEACRKKTWTNQRTWQDGTFAFVRSVRTILMSCGTWWRLALRKIGAQTRVQHGATPLFVAACCSLQRDLDVHHLVEVGASKDQTMNVGAAPTFIAAQQGHLDGALSNFFVSLASLALFYQLVWHFELLCPLCWTPWTFVSADFEPFLNRELLYCSNLLFVSKLEHMYQFFIIFIEPSSCIGFSSAHLCKRCSVLASSFMIFVEAGANKDQTMNDDAALLQVSSWSGAAFGGSWCWPRSNQERWCNTIVHDSPHPSSWHRPSSGRDWHRKGWGNTGATTLHVAAEEGGGTQAIMGNGATPCISTLSWGGCSLPGQVRDQIAPNISQLRLITKGLAERQASGENKQVPAAGWNEEPSICVDFEVVKLLRS